MRKEFVVLVLVTLGLTGMSAGAVEKRRESGVVQGLQATLTAAAPTLKRGGTISLEVELRNVSSAPLSIYRHISLVLSTPGYVVYHLTRVGGEPVDVMQPIDDHPAPRAEAYQRLGPGEAVTHQLLFGAGELDWENRAAVPAGQYELTVDVVVTEEGRAAGVQDAWIGTVRSNPVSLEILD